MTIIYVDPVTQSAVVATDSAPGIYYQFESHDGLWTSSIRFQNGSPKTGGVNGLTNEALLAMLMHRLRLQTEKLSCVENWEALGHLSAAQSALTRRTEGRVARGVEGQNVL